MGNSLLVNGPRNARIKRKVVRTSKLMVPGALVLATSFPVPALEGGRVTWTEEELMAVDVRIGKQRRQSVWITL